MINIKAKGIELNTIYYEPTVLIQDLKYVTKIMLLTIYWGDFLRKPISQETDSERIKTSGLLNILD